MIDLIIPGNTVVRRGRVRSIMVVVMEVRSEHVLKGPAQPPLWWPGGEVTPSLVQVQGHCRGAKYLTAQTQGKETPLVTYKKASHSHFRVNVPTTLTLTNRLFD